MGSRNDSGERADFQLVDDRAKAFVDRGVNCYNDGQYQAAVESYTNAIAVEHDYVDPHHFLANTYGRLRQYPKAYGEYRIALSLAEKHLPKSIRKPTIEQMMHNAALTVIARMSDQDSYTRAAEDFTEICSSMKSPPPFYHALLGQICEKQGRADIAIREFETFLSRDRDGEIKELVRAKIEKIGRQVEGQRGDGRNARSERKWRLFRKRESKGARPTDDPGGDAVDEESEPRSFEGKTKKCLNCNASLPENVLECPSCGSVRFIWE